MLCNLIGAKSLGKKFGVFLGILAIGGSIIHNISVINSILIEASEHLAPLFEVGVVTAKFGSLLTYVILTGVILETERLKVIGIIAASLIILIASLMYCDNIGRTLPYNQDTRLTPKMFNFSQIGIFVGIGAWAYEAAGTVFAIRLSLK